ncbi:MAG: hypothetical protein ACI9LY_002754 [Arenicella sp.]|jgi:hypothetical protein
MIKKVLVYTYGDQSHEAAIQAAASFAFQHDAQISGLFVRPDYVGYSGFYGEYPLNLAKTFYDLQDDYAKHAQSQFAVHNGTRSSNLRKNLNLRCTQT